MKITPLTREGFEQFWPAFQNIIQARKTYAIDPDLSFEAAYRLWCETPQMTYVAKENDMVLGSYYLKPNAAGPGDHICNCGYMVTPEARGRGVATKMCEHSQAAAVNLGYTGMQFNSVVSTNSGAVRLWQKLGYEIIGTIPGGYRHAEKGLVDCFIMFKKLL